MMPPIYTPSGKAKEYGDYAINIYKGCPHGCYYCYVPFVMHRDREKFGEDCSPRNNIVKEVEKQLERGKINNKLIHLCFACDPYPTGKDSTATREIIKLIKASGNHVQILTKGIGSRDFDLLDENDWYGITLTQANETSLKNEPGAVDTLYRLSMLKRAKKKGIKTWISCEPVLDPSFVEALICKGDGVYDKIAIGKLNYFPLNVNWKEVGQRFEKLCIAHGRNYIIKDNLRKDMDA